MTILTSRNLLLFLLTLIPLAGCHRSEAPQYVMSVAGKGLSPELQAAVQKELALHAGSFLKPKMVQASGEPQPVLTRGQEVYQQRCVQCHGVSGDGNGPSAKFMYPRPRDYRRGIFKFTSTPYGSHPLREDLVRTVRMGIRGTSMPGFALLPDQDQQAVVDYVIMLSRRGELETQLIEMADAEEAVVAEEVQSDLIPAVLNHWAEAEGNEVFPATPAPRFTVEHAELGKKLFLTKGCTKCHGEDGRGLTLDNKGTDIWGFPTRAADLTSGMLHGGNRPLDIYRRVYNGINGTPMPGFANAFKENPEELWNVVAYILTVTNRRRGGQTPPPGPINPYVSTSSQSTPGAVETH